MPIYRISAQEVQGIVLSDNPQTERRILAGESTPTFDLARRAMADYGLQAVLCPPGTTNITPVYWKRNRVDHFLDVLPDGESALYRVVPKQTGLAPAPYTRVNQEIVAQELRETTMIEIPKTSIMIPIIGPIATDNRLRVHEMIMHLPQR